MIDTEGDNRLHKGSSHSHEVNCEASAFEAVLYIPLETVTGIASAPNLSFGDIWGRLVNLSSSYWHVENDTYLSYV